jgi:hypothetical protein
MELLRHGKRLGRSKIHCDNESRFFENGKSDFMTTKMTTRVLAALATIFILAGPAMADTSIHAEFTADYDRIRPEPYPGIHLKNSLDVTLSGVGNVDEKNTREAGKMSDNQSGVKILGQKSPDGGPSWRVAAPDRLERIINQPQSVTTMTIEVSGTSCKFDVQFKLKPGFDEFMFKQVRNGQMGYFTEPKVSSTSCSIK